MYMYLKFINMGHKNQLKKKNNEKEYTKKKEKEKKNKKKKTMILQPVSYMTLYFLDMECDSGITLIYCSP